MNNVTFLQDNLLKELQLVDPALIVMWDEIRGVASSIRGNLKTGESPNDTPETIFKNFMEHFGALFGPFDLGKTSKLIRNQTDELNWTHLEFQQMHFTNMNPNEQNVPLEVYDSKLAAHFSTGSLLAEVQSSCWRELQITNKKIKITSDHLHTILTKAISNAPGFQALKRDMEKQQEQNFPLMQKPRLVIYPWQGVFLIAWTTYAFGVNRTDEQPGKPNSAKQLELGQVFVDAFSGEQFIFAPTRTGAETADLGSGLSVTPLSGPFTTRPLKIVRVDTSSTYRLRDTTHGRDIITFNTGGNSTWGPDLYNGNVGSLSSNLIPVSEDTDGDKNWNHTPSDTTDAQRLTSQQPAVDAHYICGKIYEWYNALAGGRKGWDNDQYTDPPVPPQPIRVLTHVWDGNRSTTRSVNAFAHRGLSGGKWYLYIAFFNGDPTATCTSANDVAFGYLSGSKFIVAHEYQHEITNCSFEDGAGAPGLIYSDWFAAVHEGLSDVFGCLFSESWIPGPEISYSGLVFRNIAFPRDPNSWTNRTGGIPCGLLNHNNDHFTDRNIVGGGGATPYDRGIILAHCAYLLGQGGVHQRASRNPVIIPVYTLGSTSLGGLNVYKAARIWYRALAYYFSTHGALTGIPTNDENTFRTLRDGCVSAAIDIYGKDSKEHKTTILAFYAAGLHPTSTSYGADVTFLRWGAEWWMSRPYIGVPSPDWSSMDLFINNGGTSEWNAQINVLDAMGNPTTFENNVYCRVRNIGDQSASNVQVDFFYAKVSTGVTTWLSMKDRSGTIQRLNIGTLAAGQSNFLDSAQNSPPAIASVKWYIPPLAVGETVNHFCIKAIVTCSNDVNSYNNEVQSNISYIPYTPASGFSMEFNTGNPTNEKIPLELHVDTTLPEGWNASIKETTSQIVLEPGEEKTFHIVINMIEGADQHLELPLDGEVKGQASGSFSAPITGTISQTTLNGEHLQGLLSAYLSDIGILTGIFDGHLDTSTGQISGKVDGTVQSAVNLSTESVHIGLDACLRPFRRVDIKQTVNGEPIGGITIQVQVPLPSDPCAQELTPTDTFVKL